MAREKKPVEKNKKDNYIKYQCELSFGITREHPNVYTKLETVSITMLKEVDHLLFYLSFLFLYFEDDRSLMFHN